MRLNTAIRKFRWPTANGESYGRAPSRLPMPNASLSHRHDATRVAGQANSMTCAVMGVKPPSRRMYGETIATSIPSNETGAQNGSCLPSPTEGGHSWWYSPAHLPRTHRLRGRVLVPTPS